MYYLFVIIISIVLTLIAFPKMLCYLLRQAGCKFALLKMQNPFLYKSIIIQITNGIPWGFQSIVIYIPKVSIKYKLFYIKILIDLYNLQIYFIRKDNTFRDIKLVNGFQQADILHNLLDKINPKNVKSILLDRNKKKLQKSSIFTGILQLVSIILLKLIAVQCKQMELRVVTSIPQKMVLFSQNSFHQRKIISFMKCMSQYICRVPIIKMQSQIINQQFQQLTLSCPQLNITAYNQINQSLCKMNKFILKAKIPLTLSIFESLKQTSFEIQIDQGIINIVPSSFEQISELIHEIFFEPYSNQTINQYDSNRISKNKINMHINQISLQLECLYEPQEDNSQSFQYLANISQVSLSFINIELNVQEFNIQSIKLNVTKLNCLGMEEIETVLIIPHFSIINQGSRCKQIKHEKIEVFCKSEQVALMGKLFRLINDRIKYDKYYWKIYQYIAKSIPQKFQNDDESKIQLIMKMMNMTQNQKQINHEQKINNEGILTYSPKPIQIQIQIKKLQHCIQLQNISYSQQRISNGQVIHKLSIGRVIVEYKNIHQFILNQFKLDYSILVNYNLLCLSIMQIHMVQNIQTLIDYLDSYTIFKHLLQFQSDDQNIHNDDNNDKILILKPIKKIININKITLKYQTQLMQLNHLQINKQQSNLCQMSEVYFSLGQCQLILNKLIQNNKSGFIPEDSHILLSFSSITINKCSININNNKNMIHLKNIRLILPEHDISLRIVNYLQNCTAIQSHIEAYLMNITNDGYRQLQHTNQLKRQQNIYIISISNPQIGMKQGIFNQHILQYGKFIRQFLQHMNQYNQIQVINQIKKCKQIQHLLISIKIHCIKIQLLPMKFETNNYVENVKKWTLEFKQLYGKTYKSENKQLNIWKFKEVENFRLKKIQPLQIKISIQQMIFKIRDYPMNLFSLHEMHTSIEFIKITNIFGMNEYFFNGGLNLGAISVNVGLGLLSGLNELSRRIKVYSRAIDQYKNTDYFMSYIQKKKNFETNANGNKNQSQQQYNYQQDHCYKPYWHVLHKQSLWNIQINKLKSTVIKILIGCTPYTTESLELSLDSLIGVSTINKTILQISDIKLQIINEQSIHLGCCKVILSSIYLDPQLRISIDLLMGIGNTPINVIFSNYIFKNILQLKQLRRDWLIIYGVKKLVSNQNSNQQYINYIELINIIAHKQLQKSQEQLTIWTVISSIDIQINIAQFNITLHDRQNYIRVQNKKIKTIVKYSTTIKKNFQKEWNCSKFQILIEKIIANFSHKSVIIMMKEKQYKENQIFLQCQNLLMNKNRFISHNNTIIFIQNLLTIKNVRLNLSNELKKTLEDIIIHFMDTSNNIEKMQQKYRKIKIKKLQTIVTMVIKRNRFSKRTIVRNNALIKINKINIKMYNLNNLIELGSKQSSYFSLSTNYEKLDIYGRNPIKTININFSSIKLYLYNSISMNEILIAQYLILIVHKSKQNISMDNICQFHNGIITLTSETKNQMKVILNFIVNMFRDQNKQKQIFQINYKQYSEMIVYGKDKIKDKLEWKYSDIRKEEKKNRIKNIKWKFTLSQMNVILMKTTQNIDIPFLKIQAQKMQMLIIISDYIEKISSNLKIYKLCILNLQQEPQTIFYNLLTSQCEQVLSLQDIIYKISIFKQDVLWSYYDTLQVSINTIQIKLTQEIYQTFYEFMFYKINEIQVKKIEEQNLNYKNDNNFDQKIPIYVKKLNIRPIKVQIWYRTASVIKRMEGINIQLKMYQTLNKFCNQQQLFDKWIKFILKQLASQIFNMIGQKLFGSNE